MAVALLVASVALVLVTVAYTAFTSRMVSEMKDSRLLTVRPRLVLDVNMRSGMWGEIMVTNVGPGAALDLDLSFAFPPTDDVRAWSKDSLVVGESRTLLPPEVDGKETAEALADAGVKVVLTGSMCDVYGNEHTVREELDLARWWRLAVDAKERLVSDPMEVTANALSDMKNSLRDVSEHIEELVEVTGYGLHLAHPDKIPSWPMKMMSPLFQVIRMGQAAPPQASPADGDASSAEESPL